MILQLNALLNWHIYPFLIHAPISREIQIGSFVFHHLLFLPKYLVSVNDHQTNLICSWVVMWLYVWYVSKKAQQQYLLVAQKISPNEYIMYPCAFMWGDPPSTNLTWIFLIDFSSQSWSISFGKLLQFPFLIFIRQDNRTRVKSQLTSVCSALQPVHTHNLSTPLLPLIP